jgi:type II secretory pathway component GspD/PulD (secretin)
MISLTEWQPRTRSLWRRVRIVPLVALLLIASPLAAAAAAKRSVTLDVKDADVHDVLKSIQKQCGIKNLVIDPGVSASGTFYFHQLPCKTALDTVLRTTGLAAKSYSGDVVAVHRR